MQPASGYRVAIDPVLLAAACPARPGDRVVDFGCGSGAAMLCLAARLAGLRLLGLDRDAGAIDLARENLALNGRVGEIATADVEDRRALIAAVQSAFNAKADQVLANPPYWPDGQGTSPAEEGRRRAHAGADLAAWIDGARQVLRPRGWLTLILPAARWAGAAAALSGFGAITLIPLWPRQGQPAKRVILRARKAVRSPSAVLSGLILHRSDGGFTSDADAILRDGQALASVDG
jgi:tRNA1(Val) A37 N6-methylase TrmN6